MELIQGILQVDRTEQVRTLFEYHDKAHTHILQRHSCRNSGGVHRGVIENAVGQFKAESFLGSSWPVKARWYSRTRENNVLWTEWYAIFLCKARSSKIEPKWALFYALRAAVATRERSDSRVYEIQKIFLKLLQMLKFWKYITMTTQLWIDPRPATVIESQVFTCQLPTYFWSCRLESDDPRNIVYLRASHGQNVFLLEPYLRYES